MEFYFSINTEVRRDMAPRTQRTTEYIGHKGYVIKTKMPYFILDEKTKSKPNGVYNRDDMVWETLKGYSKYEINVEYPHYIRDKRKKDIICMKPEHLSGYYRLNLKPDNAKDTTRPYQHDLIAKQWLYNDDVEHKIQVDHINRDRLDNHIYNLRWTTRSENNSNKKGYKGDIYKFEYALTFNVIIVKRYYGREINNLYKMDGEYYVLNDRNKLYERMLKRVDENKKPCLCVYDVNDKFIRIYLDDE